MSISAVEVGTRKRNHRVNSAIWKVVFGTVLAVGTLLGGATAATAVTTALPASSASTAVSAVLPSCETGVLYAGNYNFYAWIPSTSGYVLENCRAYQGMNTHGVQVLQENLNACYGKSLVVDGAFGPATRTALIQAQSAVGVSADGIFGPATRNAMKWTTHGQGCQSLSWIQSNYNHIYD